MDNNNHNSNENNNRDEINVSIDKENVFHELTEDEAALYDRQIRLWGVDAQRKLLNSRVLLVNMKGLGGEIAKNLVLGGINSITILDSSEVTGQDIKMNFLIERSSLGKNKAKACVENLQILNPLVKVYADCEPIEAKDSSFFSKNNFDLVCYLMHDNLDQLVHVNETCRQNDVSFICGYVFGIHGYMFVDLNNYKYICETAKVFNDESADTIEEKLKSRAEARKSEKEHELVEKEANYVSYSKFYESFKSFFNNLTPRKAKRMSKGFYLSMILFMFRDKYKRDMRDERDKELFIELKKEFLEQNNLSQDLVDDFYATQVIGDTCAVNAILGGIMAQEIIKSLSQNKEPIDNLFVFEGHAMSGIVERIGY